MSAPDFVAEVQRLRAQYPDERSAIMEALRLAQRRHNGWLPPEALREVAEAMDVTPAQAEAVASFYDMYNLEPVGRHIVEVCTNLSCALVGAKQVVDLRRRRGHLPPDRVRGRLRLCARRRRRRALSRAHEAGRRSGDRRGARAWLS